MIWALIAAAALSANAQALFQAENDTLTVGGRNGWTKITKRDGISELYKIRPYPVLSLSSAARGTTDGAARQTSTTDLYMSFDEGKSSRFRDETGNYTVKTGENVAAVEEKLSFKGSGAALFYDPSAREADVIKIYPKNTDALFYAGHNIADFSISLDILPKNMYQGEDVFIWQASTPDDSVQTIRCMVDKNRIFWQFNNFFASADAKKRKNIKISSNVVLTPRMWSHHLVRFDSKTGLLEYLVNGECESVVYVTPTEREGGEVYMPLVGERGSFTLGYDFSGFLDEFKIEGSFVEKVDIKRYAKSAGRIESAPFEIGSTESEVKRLLASGGRITVSSLKVANDYKMSGGMDFNDNAEIQFFVRAAPNFHEIDGAEWIPVKVGEELFSIRGRYLQIAADFYAGGGRDSAPYIEKIEVEYKRRSPPLPPANLQARVFDGGVILSWKDKAREGLGGYLVYYGTEKGEYFGEDALLGSSPIDVGRAREARLDNLKNGVLYYFAVAAYDDSAVKEIGEFSREIAARPLRMIE